MTFMKVRRRHLKSSACSVSESESESESESKTKAPRVLCLPWRKPPLDGLRRGGAPITPRGSGKTSGRRGTGEKENDIKIR